MSAKTLYEVGAAKADITPPLSVPCLGFAPNRHLAFSGVHDPLHARAMVVSDGSRTAALASIDALGFTPPAAGAARDFYGELRARIERRTGIPGEAVFVACTHAHSTPETIGIRPLDDVPGAVPWIERVEESVCDCVERAMRDRRPARFRAGRCTVEGVSRNRRQDPCLDTELIVLLFQAADDPHSVVLVNFACHPVIVQAQDFVSADYPGALARAVEEAQAGDCTCLFLQGACGDINPAMDDSRRFDDVRDVGERLARETGRLIAGLRADPGAVEPVRLGWAGRVIPLPSRPLPPHARDAVPPDQEEEVRCRLREGAGPFAADIRLLRLGNCLLVGIPGEPFCGMGLRIKETCRPLTGVPVGYANGYVGYLAPPAAWARGGYEVWPGPWSKVGPESVEMILGTVGELLPKV